MFCKVYESTKSDKCKGQDHTWNKLGHLAINGLSHDSANGPFFNTKEGNGKGGGTVLCHNVFWPKT